jgi:hypothetical protein
MFDLLNFIGMAYHTGAGTQEQFLVQCLRLAGHDWVYD